MDLNNAAGAYKKHLEIAFRLVKAAPVSEAEAGMLPSSLVRSCQNFAAREYERNLVPCGTHAPALLQHMEGYIRSESALELFRKKSISAERFLALTTDEYTPSYIKDFYRGIHDYSQGKIEEAYSKFVSSKGQCWDMIITYARYFEGTIRGVASASRLDSIQAYADNYDASEVDKKFPLELIGSFPSKPTHIVGCDPIYWEKYKALLLGWAKPLLDHVGLWVVCVDFSAQQIAAVRSFDARINIAVAKTGFTNSRPFYALVRFILADRLLRAGCPAVTCSDIDCFIETEKYRSFLVDASDGVTAKFVRGFVPWRSVGAEFTAWKGSAGRKMSSCMAGFLSDTFDPNVPKGNRQWWVDQMPLAMFADAAELGLPHVSSDLRKFNSVNRKGLPVKGPEDFRVSKEEFLAMFS